MYKRQVQDYAVRSQFPSLSHLFGTDNFGRDILTRIMVGGRYTLFIALVCVTSSAIIGSLLGLIAAYYPKVDNIIMRIIDIFMGIPTMMLCVSIVAALGSSMRNMMIAPVSYTHLYAHDPLEHAGGRAAGLHPHEPRKSCLLYTSRCV